MSVYVGIDVHRERSQVAAVTGDGTVELNKNVVNGSEPMLRLLGDLPAGDAGGVRGRVRLGLVRLGTQQRNRIHAVAADFGYDRSGSYLSGPGRGWLAGLDLPAASREIVTDCPAVRPARPRLPAASHPAGRPERRLPPRLRLPGPRPDGPPGQRTAPRRRPVLRRQPILRRLALACQPLEGAATQPDGRSS